MKKLFFMHIPKTGGTSMEAYLYGQYPVELISPKFNYQNFGVFDLYCMKYYSLVMGHFDIRVLNYLPEHCIKATVLREPVSLTISAVNHALRDPNFSSVNLEGKSIQQIIRDESIIKRFCNMQTGYLSSLPCFEDFPDVSEKDFVFNGIVADYDRALSHLKQFDFVGIFEEYDESLNYLSNLCGLYQPNVKPRLNVSVSNNTILDAEDLEIVKDYNALDIKLYQEGYALFLEYQQSIKTSTTERKLVSFTLETDKNYISCQPFYGYGFHKVEHNHKGFYRWTGPDALSGVTFNGANVAKCEFHVEYYCLNHFLQRVDFYINGVMIEACTVQTFGIYKAKIVYENSASYSYHGPIVLEFNSYDVFDTENDKRMRGFIISNISVTSFDLSDQ
jgi:hypothetical protein